METTAQKSKLTLRFFAAGVIMLVCIYIPSLFELLRFCLPAGGTADGVIAVLQCAFLAGFSIAALILGKRFTDFCPLKRKRPPLTLKKLLIAYALTLCTVFFVCFAADFNPNVLYLLSFFNTGDKVLSMCAQMFVYIFKVFLSLIASAFLQEGFESYLGGKRTYFPYGALTMFITFGLIEMLISPYQPVCYVLWLANIVYGLIYLICDKRLTAPLIAFIFIYIL